MSPARWNLAGIVGVLLLAALWIAWGLSSPGQRATSARRALAGAWTVTELSGEFPAQWMPPEAVVTHVEIEDALGDLRVHVFVRTDVTDYEIGAWSLVPVLGEAASWEADRFRIDLRGSEEIGLTETPDDGATTAPPWRARGTRRVP